MLFFFPCIHLVIAAQSKLFRMTSYDKSNFTLFAHAWLNKWQICDYQEDKKR